MAEYEQTRQLLDEFGLTATSQRLDAQLDEAARTKDLTYLGFLHKLLMIEGEARKLEAQEERLILTSNKHFNEWSEIMSDTRMAAAALDRLLHHASVVNIRGNSYRLRNYETSN